MLKLTRVDNKELERWEHIECGNVTVVVLRRLQRSAPFWTDLLSAGSGSRSRYPAYGAAATLCLTAQANRLPQHETARVFRKLGGSDLTAQKREAAEAVLATLAQLLKLRAALSSQFPGCPPKLPVLSSKGGG